MLVTTKHARVKYNADFVVTVEVHNGALPTLDLPHDDTRLLVGVTLADSAEELVDMLSAGTLQALFDRYKQAEHGAIRPNLPRAVYDTGLEQHPAHTEAALDAAAKELL